MAAQLRETVGELERRRARDHRGIRSAVAMAVRSGLTQRDIASLLSRSQPEISRLVTTSAARSADGARRTWMTARSAVDAAARELRQGEELTAFTMLIQAIDHLRALESEEDIAEWAVAPVRIPHEGLDTLFQALTDREFRELRLPVPAWAAPEPVGQPWILAATPARVDRVKSRTPTFLAKLGVYVSDRDLVTA